MPASLENSAVATGLENVSFISIPKKVNAKECSNYHTIALISHASKVMLKILQAMLQQYTVHEVPDVQARFRKGRGKPREFQKNIYFCLLTMPKPLTVWITTNCGKFFKRQESQITWPASWEICTQVKKQQLELDMEQQTGSKSGKEFVKVVYCHPAYLLYMQSTSCAMPGWMMHKLESRLPLETPITSEMQMTPPYRRKQRGA